MVEESARNNPACPAEAASPAAAEGVAAPAAAMAAPPPAPAAREPLYAKVLKKSDRNFKNSLIPRPYHQTAGGSRKETKIPAERHRPTEAPHQSRGRTPRVKNHYPNFDASFREELPRCDVTQFQRPPFIEKTPIHENTDSRSKPGAMTASDGSKHAKTFENGTAEMSKSGFLNAEKKGTQKMARPDVPEKEINSSPAQEESAGLVPISTAGARDLSPNSAPPKRGVSPHSKSPSVEGTHPEGHQVSTFSSTAGEATDRSPIPSPPSARDAGVVNSDHRDFAQRSVNKSGTIVGEEVVSNENGDELLSVPKNVTKNGNPREGLDSSPKLLESSKGSSSLEETVVHSIKSHETFIGDPELHKSFMCSSKARETFIGSPEVHRTDAENTKLNESIATNDSEVSVSEHTAKVSEAVNSADSMSNYPIYGGETFVSYHVKKMTGQITTDNSQPTTKSSPNITSSPLLNSSSPAGQSKAFVELAPETKNEKEVEFGRGGGDGAARPHLVLSNPKDPLAPQHSMLAAMKNNMIDKTVRFAPDVDLTVQKEPRRSSTWTNVRNVLLAKSKAKTKRPEISEPVSISGDDLQSSLSKEQLSKLALFEGAPRTNYRSSRLFTALPDSPVPPVPPGGPPEEADSPTYEPIRFADEEDECGSDDDSLYCSVDVSPKMNDAPPGPACPPSIAGPTPHDHLQLPKASPRAQESHVQLLSSETGTNSLQSPKPTDAGGSIKPAGSRATHSTPPSGLERGLQTGPFREEIYDTSYSEVSPNSKLVKEPADSSPVSPSPSSLPNSGEKVDANLTNVNQKLTSLKQKFQLPLPPPSENNSRPGVSSAVSSLTRVNSKPLDAKTDLVRQNSAKEAAAPTPILCETPGKLENNSHVRDIQSQEATNTPQKSRTFSSKRGESPAQPPFVREAHGEERSHQPQKSPKFSIDKGRFPTQQVVPAQKTTTSPSSPESELQRRRDLSQRRQPAPAEEPLQRSQPSPAGTLLAIEEPLLRVEHSPVTVHPPLAAEEVSRSQVRREQSSVVLRGSKDDVADSFAAAPVEHSNSPRQASRKPAFFLKESSKFSPSTKTKHATEKKLSKSVKKTIDSSNDNLKDLNPSIPPELKKSQVKKKSWFGSLTRRFGSKSRIKPEKDSPKLGLGKPKETTLNNNFNSNESFDDKEGGSDSTVSYEAKRTSLYSNVTDIVPLGPDRKAVSMGNVHSVKKSSKVQTHDLPITPTEIYERRASVHSSSTAKPPKGNYSNLQEKKEEASKFSFGQKKFSSSSALVGKSEKFTPRVVGVVLKKGESLDSVIDAQTATFTALNQPAGGPGHLEPTQLPPGRKQPEKLTLKRSKSDANPRPKTSHGPSNSFEAESNISVNEVALKSEGPSLEESTPVVAKKGLREVEESFTGVQSSSLSVHKARVDSSVIILPPNDPRTPGEGEELPSGMTSLPGIAPDGLTAFKRRLKDSSFDSYRTAESTLNDTWESIAMEDEKTILHKSRSVEKPPVVRTHHHVTRSASEPRFWRSKDAAPKPSELIEASKMAPILADHMNKHKQIVCEEAGVQLHLQQNQLAANRRLLITDLDDVFTSADPREGRALRSSTSLDSSDSTHQSSSQASVQLRPRSVSFEGTEAREYPVSQYRPETEKIIAEAKKKQKEQEAKKHQMVTRSFDGAKPKASRVPNPPKGKPIDLLIHEAKMGKQDSLPVQKVLSYDAPDQIVKDVSRIQEVPIREDRLVKNPIYQSISEKDHSHAVGSSGTAAYTLAYEGNKPTWAAQDSRVRQNFEAGGETKSRAYDGHKRDRRGSDVRVPNEGEFYGAGVVRGTEPQFRSVSRAGSSASHHTFKQDRSDSHHQCNHPDHHRPPPSSYALRPKQSYVHPGYLPVSPPPALIVHSMRDGANFGLDSWYPAISSSRQMVVPVRDYSFPLPGYVPVVQTHQVTQPVLSASSLNIYHAQQSPSYQYDSCYQMRYSAQVPHRPSPPRYARYRPYDLAPEPYTGRHYAENAKSEGAEAAYHWASSRLASEPPEVQARYLRDFHPVQGGFPGIGPPQSGLVPTEIDAGRRQVSPLAYSTLKEAPPPEEEDVGALSEVETAPTRRLGAPRHAPPAEEEVAAMSEGETACTGRGRAVRGGLPVVRSHNRTLERPMGAVFLQYRQETRRAVLPNEVTSMDTVKALFVRAFPRLLTMADLDAPNTRLYIRDAAAGLFYQLQDLSDVRDRSVLKIFEGEDVDGARRPSAASTLDGSSRPTDAWGAVDQSELTEAEAAANHIAEKAAWRRRSHERGPTF